jgi:hypothetical protein
MHIRGNCVHLTAKDFILGTKRKVIIVAANIPKTIYKMFKEDFAIEHDCYAMNEGSCPFNEKDYPWEGTELPNIWIYLTLEARTKIHNHFCNKRSQRMHKFTKNDCKYFVEDGCTNSMGPIWTGRCDMHKCMIRKFILDPVFQETIIKVAAIDFKQPHDIEQDCPFRGFEVPMFNEVVQPIWNCLKKEAKMALYEKAKEDLPAAEKKVTGTIKIEFEMSL